MGTKVTLAFSKVTTYVIYFCILTILTTTTLSITLKHNMPEIILPTISMTENQFPEQFIARFGFVPVGVFFIIFQIVFHWHEIHQPNRKRSLFSSLILNSLLVCGFLCGICLAGQSLFPVSTHWNLNFINWVWETHWDFDTGVHHIFSTSLFFFAFFHMFFAVVYDLFFQKNVLENLSTQCSSNNCFHLFLFVTRAPLFVRLRGVHQKGKRIYNHQITHVFNHRSNFNYFDSSLF
eukprot:Anaeramoba_flamelloidesc42866_g1_i3.p1 GENE.c42866_g1_i3~~c42866_g1_i3.p1  ORF type:complete len:252 (-),score=19.14 c42866_g1_i3:149-853(-)